MSRGTLTERIDALQSRNALDEARTQDAIALAKRALKDLEAASEITSKCNYTGKYPKGKEKAYRRLGYRLSEAIHSLKRGLA